MAADMSFKSPCLHRVIHLVPDLKISGVSSFVLDLCESLPGIHSVVTLTRPDELDHTMDKVFAGHGILVYYSDGPYFRASLIRCIHGSHVIMYDATSAMFIPYGDDPGTEFPSVYYGYNVFDGSVKCRHKLVSREDLQAGVEVCTPGVDRSRVRRQLKKQRIAGAGTSIGLFFGSEESYDINLAAAAAAGIDENLYLMLSDPVNMEMQHPGLELAISQAAENKRISRCPVVFGTLANYLGYVDAVVDTGCVRINAEAGAAEIPLLPRCRTVEEINRYSKLFREDESFKKECEERSRESIRDTDIRISSITIRNLLFEVHM